MTSPSVTIEFLSHVIEAHGGAELWTRFTKIDATIVSGGGFFALKGTPQDPDPRRMTVWLHEERSSVTPYGAPDQRTMFTPERIAIEKLDGAVVAERRARKDSFAGHQTSTPWHDRRRCPGRLLRSLAGGRGDPQHKARASVRRALPGYNGAQMMIASTRNHHPSLTPIS